MMWQCSARRSISRLRARALWVAGCLFVLLSACKPGVFSSNPRAQADGPVRGADAGLEPGAGPDAGSAAVGGARKPQAGSAGAGSAGTSRATAGSSGKAAAQGGGASGKSAAQDGGGSGNAAAQGGAAAASAGSAAGGRGATGGERAPAAGSGEQPPAAAGAGGAPGPACPPADLSALRVNKLSDAVLGVPDPKLEISTGPVVRARMIQPYRLPSSDLYLPMTLRRLSFNVCVSMSFCVVNGSASSTNSRICS